MSHIERRGTVHFAAPGNVSLLFLYLGGKGEKLGGYADRCDPCDQHLSFEQFTSDYRKYLTGVASVLLEDWHAAEDLTQDALMIMHRRWQDVEPRARAAYARTVISHLATRLRRSSRHQHEDLYDLLPEASGCCEDEDVTRRLTIAAAIDGLPERQRQAVYLRYWDGLSTDEIAKRLEIPAGTARSDLTRANKYLQRALGDGTFDSCG